VPREHILVIEDEEDVLELVRYNLAREGYTVGCAESGEAGLELARREHPDLIVLDLMLPGLDGLEVCRLLKADPLTEDISVVMLTARGEEADIVTGLEMGADDYLPKPFSPRVLLARIKAVLRRRSRALPDPGDVLKLHGMVIDPVRHKVSAGGRDIDLTHTEFRILHFLASRPGWVFTRYQIIDAVHGETHAVLDRSVDVQIAGLRKKLGEAGKYIETVRGVGYRFRET